MSQANPKYPEYDIVPKRETRGPAPITNLPVNALSGGSDPTEELRNYIQELQNASRSASEHARQAEIERDHVQVKLEQVLDELRASKGREEEFRARFVEVTAMIRERDEAVASRDQHVKTISELQRRFDALQRQMAEEKENRESLARDRDEVRARFAEAQKQILSIRQARDGAQAQNLELNDRIRALRDEIDDWKQECEIARMEAAETAGSSKELEALKRQIEEDRATAAKVCEERDAARKDVESLRTELDAATAQSESLRQEIERLSVAVEERDASRQRVEAQAEEITTLQAQVESLKSQISEAGPVESQRDAFRRQIEALCAERDAMQHRVKGLLDESVAQQQRMSQLAEQLTALQNAREKNSMGLSEAQAQIDALLLERERFSTDASQHTRELQAQIAVLRDELAGSHNRVNEVDARFASLARERDQALEKAAKFEQQRLQAIDLAQQLDNAKHEIIRLSADLAEARLLAKSIVDSAARKAALAEMPSGGSEPRPASEPKANQPWVHEEFVDMGDEPLGEKEARGYLVEIKRCHQAYSKNPEDTSLLNELHCHVHHLAERARISGFVALHRLGEAFAGLSQELYQFPEQVNPSTVRTLSQTIDCLGILLRQRNYSALKDPGTALVYAVDDDPDVCVAISLALETGGLRTKSSQEPAIALSELADERVDLILLDVALPNMDGFELCQHIRGLPLHGRTPIVFLTGLTTLENRMQSSVSGGDDFIGKPFNLRELSLKALTLVLKASLSA